MMPHEVRAESVASILKKADEVRNPSDSYLMTVDVKSTDAADSFTFEVSLKGNTKTLIETLKPAASAGKKYLMLDEEMWAFTPKMSKPARVSLNERLTGMTANGDISRMRWSGDYDGTIEKSDGKSWQLLLKATRKDLTYEKLRVWIAHDTYRPTKAEFLTPRGTLLKTATYGGYKELAGKQRPTEIVITSAGDGTKSSTISVVSMKNKTFPASVFSQSALK